MKLKTTLKVKNIGNSQGVIIDKRTVNSLNLKIRDRFDIKIYEKHA